MSAIDRMQSEYFLISLKLVPDTVNHVILFEKPEQYGIRGLALDWVESCFSERSQFVEYNNQKSSFDHETWGATTLNFRPLVFLYCIILMI